MVLTMLDGGFAYCIEKHLKDEVVDSGHPMWASRFVVTNKEAVINAHRDFIKAGSTIVRTNSYQSSIEGFMKYMGLTEDQAIGQIEASVQLVRKAIELENKKQGEITVCGSVGSYGAYLHDGSEYTGAYAESITEKELMDWHRSRLSILIKSGCELIAFETIPCSKEAFALIKLIKEFPSVKAWLSFSVKDEKRLSNGELFSEVVDKCWKEGKDNLVAIGTNCVDPKFVAPLLGEAKKLNPDIPFVVYPNSGEVYNKSLNRWEIVGELKPIEGFLDTWFSLGVKYIGCCCRTSVQDLVNINRKVKQWNLQNK